ncbi:4-hydroxythreonine-4-phosphate dehydrogenase PdxA [Thalassospira sp.]|uniref:4-hydroxythreonine-4-phosphate dehydrogenase PdxA n=1 Tax=Thalassospira sp. TaxID=1912094 RepID=UPI00273730CF|nr:4-hydroxythreonine-4-phosphate dehydrogenase PdxA [Thalassospira sp.]MDP2700055.1 4-hydroxythreonine-4-phosphate dehydrogenase PdxA [Thalassospira sp.]
MADIKPLAMTIGEPGGIGPELALKAWLTRKAEALPAFFVIAPSAILRDQENLLQLDVPIVEISNPGDVADVFETALPIYPLDLPCPSVHCGTASPDTAAIVIASIMKAVELTRMGATSAVVTNPIQKSALYQAGFAHPGHTEFLAELAGPGTIPVMMLANSQLRVVPMTIHIALSRVPDALTIDLIIRLAHITSRALTQDFGISYPRLAIAGLNPHAGEDGAMGDEEQTVMIPAIRQLQQDGLNVVGPMSADTMFHAEARAHYDVALCPYHDQALIPVKTLDFHGGVNVTLGLPFIRTSPDHGTALNIAGKGIARPDSLIAAIRMAASMARNRQQAGEPTIDR